MVLNPAISSGNVRATQEALHPLLSPPSSGIGSSDNSTPQSNDVEETFWTPERLESLKILATEILHCSFVFSGPRKLEERSLMFVADVRVSMT